MKSINHLQKKGLSELEGGAMMEKGLRGPLCSMALLGYHTVMTYVLGMNLDHFENFMRFYKIREIKMPDQNRIRINGLSMSVIVILFRNC